MLTALRILNLVIWGALLLCMIPGAQATVRGKEVRRGDPWRLGVAAVSIVIILGNIRWLVAPDNAALFIAIYVLTAIVGGYKIVLAKTYGRGPKL
jgi:hypothetical protein